MVMPQDLKHTAFSAWQSDRIFSGLGCTRPIRRTCSRVPAINRTIAEHLRQYLRPVSISNDCRAA